MLRKKKPAFIIAFDATTQAMATDKLCAKNWSSRTINSCSTRNYRRLWLCLESRSRR